MDSTRHNIMSFRTSASSLRGACETVLDRECGRFYAAYQLHIIELGAQIRAWAKAFAGPKSVQVKWLFPPI